MTTTRRVLGSRRRAAALLLALPLLAGCGFSAQTNEVYQPAVGTDARTGQVDVLSGVVVSPDDGSGALVATLVNNNQNSADTLESVTGPDGVTVSLDSPVQVPAAGAVNLADTGGIAVSGSPIDVTRSSFVEFTFTFTTGDPVTLGVPVVRDDGPYADLPSPGSSPSAEG